MPKLVLYPDETIEGMRPYRQRPVDGFQAVQMAHDFEIQFESSADCVAGDAGDYLVRLPDGNLAVWRAADFRATFQEIRPRLKVAADHVDALAEGVAS